MQLIGDKLSSVRGGRVLFADLSFAVAAGETLVVTGANGSGKTSLLRTIAGCCRRRRGEFVLKGRRVTNLCASSVTMLGTGTRSRRH